jgi:hypothetical protein
MNKSTVGVNEQWYQFIYNNDGLDSGSEGGKSRFSLHSKISRKSYVSRISQMKIMKKMGQKFKNPREKLKELIGEIDICRFIRINWLLAPIINA